MIRGYLLLALFVALGSTCEVGNVKPYPGTCRAYLRCEGGHYVKTVCPDGKKYFNVVSGKCSLWMTACGSAECVEEAVETLPGCKEYATCRGGKRVTLACPGSTMYDPSTSTCTEGYHCTTSTAAPHWTTPSARPHVTTPSARPHWTTTSTTINPTITVSAGPQSTQSVTTTEKPESPTPERSTPHTTLPKRKLRTSTSRTTTTSLPLTTSANPDAESRLLLPCKEGQQLFVNCRHYLKCEYKRWQVHTCQFATKISKQFFVCEWGRDCQD